MSPEAATTELAVHTGQPPTLATVGEALTVEHLIGQVRLIQDVMAGVMRDGEHFGLVPGAGNKKTLFKPGAEKLLMTFRIAVEPDVEDLSTDSMIRYRVRARAISQDGNFLGAGVGECSSAEEKYAWRAIKSPAEFDEAAPEDRRIKHGMSNNKPIQAKQVRTNAWDYANTVLKMAKKRAVIDMCLTVLAASDIFAQDLEDLPGGEQYASPVGSPTGTPAGAPPPSASSPAPAPAPAPGPSPAPSAITPPVITVEATIVESPAAGASVPAETKTPAQLIRDSLAILGWSEETLLQGLRAKGVSSLDELTPEQVVSLTAFLQDKIRLMNAAV